MNLGDKKQMVQDNNDLEVVKELKKALKPKLYCPIWNTIICSGPPLNLIFRYFLERDIKDPTVAIILTVISMIWCIINWYWYAKARNDFKKNWQEISAELETLNFKEKPSKDYIDIIFDRLQITSIASLVASLVFIAIAILTKLSYLKYFILFSLLIFVLTVIGIIVVGTIIFFNFLKEVKKWGGLKNVLKRLFLTFIILFIIQMILSLIIQKNMDWFMCLLRSLLMTLPISISAEALIIYKKIKKEYLMNTSPDESESE